MAALLAISALLLALLVGCSAAGPSQPPPGGKGPAPSVSKGAPVSQAVPVLKMSPNTPQIVRAPAAEPHKGGARLAIDEASYDFGKVKLQDWVKAVFHVKNVGDTPLTINGEPLVRALEGC